MALTLTTKARNASADARTALVNEGSGAGKVRIYTAAFASMLVEIAFDDPAFAAASSGSASASGLPNSGTAVATGTADVYRVMDSDNEEMWAGAVGSDLTLDNTSIVSGQTVSIASWAHAQAAS
ncbi:MAG TPA: hypothetical protein VFZ21_30900 [Gemmatimonadaceae bacterium]|nr:hypothetical protein [Gemmatimonadaceae bacterium]